MINKGELMQGVEGGDNDKVYLTQYKGAYYITGYNEGGYNSVSINLNQVLVWLSQHRPELLDIKITSPSDA